MSNPDSDTWGQFLTPEYRKLFEKKGYDLVLKELVGHAYSLPDKRFAAAHWLYEERRRADSREDSRYWVPVLIAIGALLVSVVVAGISAWQSYESVRYNKLSVRPHLGYHWESSQNGKEGQFAIINQGVGPAIITKYRVSLDKQYAGSWKADFFKTIHQKIGIPGNVEPRWTNFGDTVVIGAGERQTLYGYKTDKRVDEAYIHDLNNRLSFEIYFCSLFEECWWVKY